MVWSFLFCSVVCEYREHGVEILFWKKRARHEAARWSCHAEGEIIPQPYGLGKDLVPCQDFWKSETDAQGWFCKSLAKVRSFIP
jgi:hypothetical protein